MKLLLMMAKGCEDTLILIIDKMKGLLSFFSFQKIKPHVPLKSFISHSKKNSSKIISYIKKTILIFHPLNIARIIQHFSKYILSFYSVLIHMKKCSNHPVPITIFIILSGLAVLIANKSMELNKKLSLGVNDLTSFQKMKYATVVPYRPAYYKRYEKQFQLNHLAIPIHIKNKKKLKRIYMDFTVETSSRSLKEYLSKRTHLIESRFNSLIEPIIPDLPMEKEGKTIIVQKLKREINQLIKDLKLKGRVEKIYVHSILII